MLNEVLVESESVRDVHRPHTGETRGIDDAEITLAYVDPQRKRDGIESLAHPFDLYEGNEVVGDVPSRAKPESSLNERQRLDEYVTRRDKAFVIRFDPILGDAGALVELITTVDEGE
jgi:hypothetical protein